MNYYERHLGDYARDTAHLSLVEHGVYNLLLDRYYTTEAGIPCDQAYRLARAKTKDEREAVDAVLAEFFTLADGTYVNNRCEEEIQKARGRIGAARSNGKKGGRPPKNPMGSENKTQQKPNGFSVGSENKTQQKAHQTPDTIKAKEGAPSAAPIDFRTEVFRRWKALPDGGGGAYLAKVIAEYGEDAALNAADRTMEAERADPKGFVRSILRGNREAETAHDALMARVQ